MLKVMENTTRRVAGHRVKKMLAAATLSGMTVSLAACGSIPDAKVQYSLATTNVDIKVVRTVTCDANNNVYVISNATVVPEHRADLQAKHSIDLAGIGGGFSDNTVHFDFFADGRLKGLNAKSTGRGKEVFEGVTSLVASVAGAVFFTGVPGAAPSPDYAAECAHIAAAGSEKAPSVTLVYSGTLIPEESRSVSLTPRLDSMVHAEQLKRALGNIVASVVAVEAQPAPVAASSGNSNAVMVTLRQPASATVQVVSTGGISGDDGEVIWSGRLPAAQSGTEYGLPVPKSALFGSQHTEFSLLESGQLATLEYGNVSGAPQVLSLAGTVLDAAAGPTTEQQLAATRAEADLIAQQQRLARCKADPTNCQ